MSSALHVAPHPAPSAPRPERNTLQKLWRSVYLILIVDAVLLATAIIGAQVHRDTMKTVGRDTAPSIIAAQHIKSALADMDADAANELLGWPDTIDYEKQRKDAATALIEAAKNVTRKKGDQAPIEAIQVGMGLYEIKIQRARDLREFKDHTFVDVYREAAAIMDGELLPKADALDKANLDEMEGSYGSLEFLSVGSVFLMLVAGVAMLIVLVMVQKFLTERMHRVLNPGLAAATLLTFVFIAYTFVTLGSESHGLKVAKKDAFDSIHALWRARAVAYAAKADESRYLLDTAHAGQHERAFSDKVEGSSDSVRSHLAAEMRNITFAGEREAAQSTVDTFQKYLDVDKGVRKLQNDGKAKEALALCIGTDEDQSNGAFTKFDKALGDTIRINQGMFDQAVDQGIDALSYFELKASIIAVIIALLAFFGLLQRIREYR